MALRLCLLHGQAEGGEEARCDHRLQHEGVFSLTADRWNFIWIDMPANSEKEPLSIVVFGHVGSGRITTTGRLLSELGCTPERKLDELKQDAERLEKSSLVCKIFMVRQEEEWERGASINCNTKEFLTDKWQYTTTDTPGHRNLINNMTAGASRSSTLLRMEQTNNDVNKMDYDNAGNEQVWREETSNEMKKHTDKGGAEERVH